jgi:hypothetical protein
VRGFDGGPQRDHFDIRDSRIDLDAVILKVHGEGRLVERHD